jgi:uncharacterized protein (TIGR01777 family)
MAKLKERVLIAGGTGLIGKKLGMTLSSLGCEVRVLSRNPKNDGEYYWNPEKSQMDVSSMDGITILVNLSGAGIADKRWTANRKKELIESRVESNHFLFEHISHMPDLKQFVCASGINAYGFKSARIHTEEDSFGKDFLSQLVKRWEESADLFSLVVPVVKIRTAVVLSADGGALKKMVAPAKWGLSSALGDGNQIFAWIHEDDLTGIYTHVIQQRLHGSFNAVGGCCSNLQFMKQLALSLGKPFRLPNVPAFIIRAALGEMSSMLLQGVSVSNEKIKETGFSFRFNSLSKALNELLPL